MNTHPASRVEFIEDIEMLYVRGLLGSFNELLEVDRGNWHALSSWVFG